jgi:TonB family protein
MMPRTALAASPRVPLLLEPPALRPDELPARLPGTQLPQLSVPRRPAEKQVVTNVFEEAPRARVVEPVRAALTGSFGTSEVHAAAVNAKAQLPIRSGGFDSAAAEGRTVATAAQARTVAAAGFAGAAGQPVLRAAAAQVEASAFTEITAAARARGVSNAPAPATATAIEILHKPRPAYTEEARRLQLEGEVLVEAVFSVAGEVRVIRVVRGLGHGLDEAAVDAARGIRFRPATRNGVSVDATATVRISFQIAY